MAEPTQNNEDVDAEVEAALALAKAKNAKKDLPGPAMTWDVKAPTNDVNPIAATAAAGLQGLSLNNLDDLAGLIGGADAKAKARAFLQASNRAAPVAAPVAQGAGNLATQIYLNSKLGGKVGGGSPVREAAEKLAAAQKLRSVGVGTALGAAQGSGGADDEHKVAGAVAGGLLGAAPAAGGLVSRGVANTAAKHAGTLGFASHEGAKRLGQVAGATAGAMLGGVGGNMLGGGPVGTILGAGLGGAGGIAGGEIARRAILGRQVPLIQEAEAVAPAADDLLSTIAPATKPNINPWQTGMGYHRWKALTEKAAAGDQQAVETLAAIKASTPSSKPWTSIGVVPGKEVPMQWEGGLYGATKNAAKNAPNFLDSKGVQRAANTYNAVTTSAGNAIANQIIGDKADREGALAASAAHNREMATNMAYRKKFNKKMNKE